MSQRASVRNLDLRLRAAFPLLKTEIYELHDRCHVIVSPKDQMDASTFQKEFRDSWRMIGDNVEFSNTPPQNGKVIPSIADHEIGRNIAGTYFNRDGLITVLAGKFPNLSEITGIRDGRDGKLYFGVTSLPHGEFLADLGHIPIK